MSSSVLGRCSSPGFVMTILKPPASDSLATLDSCTVESERARRWAGLLKLRSSRSSVCSGSVVGVDGTWLGVHDESCNLPTSTMLGRLSLSLDTAPKPAVCGGVTGKTKFGCGCLWCAGRTVGLKMSKPQISTSLCCRNPTQTEWPSRIARSASRHTSGRCVHGCQHLRR